MLWFISFIMLYLSSSMNWIQICMTFVQSFPQGFKETLMFWRKCLTPRSNMERSQSEEITLQDMRIIPGTGENISFNENWPWRGRLNICKKIIAISWTQFQKKVWSTIDKVWKTKKYGFLYLSHKISWFFSASLIS